MGSLSDIHEHLRSTKSLKPTTCSPVLPSRPLNRRTSLPTHTSFRHAQTRPSLLELNMFLHYPIYSFRLLLDSPLPAMTTRTPSNLAHHSSTPPTNPSRPIPLPNSIQLLSSSRLIYSPKNSRSPSPSCKLTQPSAPIPQTHPSPPCYCTCTP